MYIYVIFRKKKNEMMRKWFIKQFFSFYSSGGWLSTKNNHKKHFVQIIIRFYTLTLVLLIDFRFFSVSTISPSVISKQCKHLGQRVVFPRLVVFASRKSKSSNKTHFSAITRFTLRCCGLFRRCLSNN